MLKLTSPRPRVAAHPLLPLRNQSSSSCRLSAPRRRLSTTSLLVLLQASVPLISPRPSGLLSAPHPLVQRQVSVPLTGWHPSVPYSLRDSLRIQPRSWPSSRSPARPITHSSVLPAPSSAGPPPSWWTVERRTISSPPPSSSSTRCSSCLMAAPCAPSTAPSPAPPVS